MVSSQPMKPYLKSCAPRFFLTSTFAFHSSSIYIFLTELVSLKNCPKIVSKCNILCGSSVQTMTSTALNIPCFLILFLVFCICIIFGLICLIFALICLIFALIHLWFICIYVCGIFVLGLYHISYMYCISIVFNFQIVFADHGTLEYSSASCILALFVMAVEQIISAHTTAAPLFTTFCITLHGIVFPY